MTAFELYRELGARGLIVGSSGNVSERDVRGMIITPSGGAPDGVDVSGMAVMTLDGTVLNDATPSSEWEMHAAIYRAFPEAGCIVHAHADACTALACLHRDLPPFHYMVLGFGGTDVRCAPYTTFGTPALAALAVKALKGRNACLLANHGMILFARDANQALARTLLLESLCRQYLLALSAGKPKLLSAAQLRAAKQRFKSYGPRVASTVPPPRLPGKAPRRPHSPPARTDR